jgi:hypothetical protein
VNTEYVSTSLPKVILQNLHPHDAKFYCLAKDKLNVSKLESTVRGWQILSEIKFLTNKWFNIK